MVNLGKHLRDGDPLADAPALPPLDVQRIRRAVLAEAGRPSPAWWPGPVIVAATVAATLAAGVVIGHRLPREAPGVVDTREWLEPGRRQVQFATPGGTRIIWVIDPDFDL
jgi:hypothetical protein